MNTGSDKRVKCVLRIMEVLSPDHRLMADISNIIGYHNAIKLMKYLSGESVTFPSEDVALVDSKYVEAYVRYKLMGEPWELMLSNVYGDSLNLETRLATKGRIRTLSCKLKDYSSELESIALSDIEEYRELLKEEV